MNNKKTTLTQHGIRNGDASRRPQESQSPPEAVQSQAQKGKASALGTQKQALRRVHLWDNNQLFGKPSH
jgi:hypothetical protein